MKDSRPLQHLVPAVTVANGEVSKVPERLVPAEGAWLGSRDFWDYVEEAVANGSGIMIDVDDAAALLRMYRLATDRSHGPGGNEGRSTGSGANGDS